MSILLVKQDTGLNTFCIFNNKSRALHKQNQMNVISHKAAMLLLFFICESNSAGGCDVKIEILKQT